MNYIQITIAFTGEAQREILIALLDNIGYEGFEESGDYLIATIPEHLYQKEALAGITGQMGLVFKEETILPQNWNALWEAGFEPVTVEGFCTVRASFHQLEITTPYEIIITPKMSFGTGHHATTQLMMEAMRGIDFNGKSVLDFGTGTGILAILAKKLGAAAVTAIDHDEWSIENAGENAAMNNVELTLAKASMDEIPPAEYDVLLANINRNILLQYMSAMNSQLNTGATLLLSGILAEDEAAIMQSAQATGFAAVGSQVSNGWMAIKLRKES